MRRFWIVVVCLLALGVSCARPRKPVPVASLPRLVPQPSPRTVAEVRAVWVSDTPKLDWDSATRELKRTGFNTMYVNLASGGAAFYPRSHVLPSVTTDGSDEVARGIELAHRRGLAVHAKLIVMFMFKAPAEFQKRLVKADRVMRGADGKPILQSGFTWLCPSQAANREQMVAAVTEMVSRYPVDGLQFDYLRFFEEPTCFCAECRKAFEGHLGKPVKHWPGDALNGALTTQFNEWRQQLISRWAHDLAVAGRQARPGLKVSAAVFPLLARAREEKAQDWKGWLDHGDLDYVCTMNYTIDLNEFEQRCRNAQTMAARERVMVGLAGWKMGDAGQLWTQINTVRRLGAPGFVLFSYDDAATRNFLPDLTEKAGPSR